MFAVSEIISNFKGEKMLTKIPDIFNDNLIYDCRTFDDIKGLNSEMLLVAGKYELFSGGQRAIEELNKFKDNFEILQTFLGEIEEKMIDASSMDKYDNEVEVMLPFDPHETNGTTSKSTLRTYSNIRRPSTR